MICFFFLCGLMYLSAALEFLHTLGFLMVTCVNSPCVAKKMPSFVSKLSCWVHRFTFFLLRRCDRSCLVHLSFLVKRACSVGKQTRGYCMKPHLRKIVGHSPCPCQEHRVSQDSCAMPMWRKWSCKIKATHHAVKWWVKRMLTISYQKTM